MTEPRTHAATPASFIADRTSEATEADTTATMPTPRFRESSMPTQVTSPPRRTQSNTAGMVHVERSTVATAPTGRTRDRFAARPPPVTCE